MKGGLLLNVVVTQSSSVFQLLASEDESLPVRRDTLLILDLRLHVVDSVGGLDLEGDGLPGESLNECVSMIQPPAFMEVFQYP